MRDTFLDSDAIWLGLLWGLFLPIVSFALIDGLFDYIIGPAGATPTSERTRMLIAICMNLVPMQIYKRWRYNETVQGIVLSTVGLAGVWIFYYFKTLS